MVQIGQSYELDSYFSMHRGCNVTLYQDTKVPQDLPHLKMVQGPHGAAPPMNSCWEDLYYSINNARHIICITGWSGNNNAFIVVILTYNTVLGVVIPLRALPRINAYSTLVYSTLVYSMVEQK